MVNGFVSWSESRDPIACSTDDPVNYMEVSRDPFRTPFQWSSGKNSGLHLSSFFIYEHSLDPIEYFVNFS